MPLLNPRYEEIILSELREKDVLGPELIGEILSDQNDFRLLDKLIEYRDKINPAKWISFQCKDPNIAYYGLHKPSPSFLKSLELTSSDKETLFNYGSVPFRLEHDVLWMCGLKHSHEVIELSSDIFSSISFKSLRYCALPLSLIAETVSLL